MNRTNQARYFYLEEKMPPHRKFFFTTFGNRVGVEFWEDIPEELREAAKTYDLITFLPICEQTGYKVVQNRWTAKHIRLSSKDGIWKAKVVATHPLADKPLHATFGGETMRDALSNFWNGWNQKVVNEYGHLNIHTHIIFTEPKKYLEC